MVRSLPSRPNVENLRKQAKTLAKEKGLPLAKAQFALAAEYGFPNWAKLLKAARAGFPAANPGLEFDRLRDFLEAGDDASALALAQADPGFLSRSDPNRKSRPLHHAAWHGRAAVVAGFLDFGADIEALSGEEGETALHQAAGMNRLEVARLLLARGANPRALTREGSDPLARALYYEEAGIWLDLLLPLGARKTIFTALAAGDEAQIRALVRDDPEALRARHPYGRGLHLSPLHYAVTRNKANLVNLLLDLGADPLVLDEKARTAADFALGTARVEAYRALEARGQQAAPGLLAQVGTPERAAVMARLHGALVQGNLETVRTLIDADPSLVNAKFPDFWGTGGTGGAAPLHWAAMFGHVEIARWLLEKGADLGLKDDTYGSTPLGWAREFHRADMEAFLLSRES